ncbi:hypothetical protein QL093DRAFT_2592096 [Fusarium oxysporum]|nr:hypothetical protein QL093DRAFT_2592096 [Fusarium oxysporum]
MVIPETCGSSFGSAFDISKSQLSNRIPSHSWSLSRNNLLQQRDSALTQLISPNLDTVFRSIFEMPDKESIAGTSSSFSFETTQSVAGNSALSNLRRTRSVASQLATVRPKHLDVAQPSSLPSLYIDGLRYILEDWIHKKRRRSLSWILRYGKYVIRLSDDGTAGGRYWVCGLCNARNQVKILEAKATTSPIYHLNNDYHIYKPSTAHDNGPDSEPESSNRTSPAPSSSVSVLDMQKRAAKRRPLIVESRADIFKRLLLGWITDANIPLYDDGFVIEVLPTSGNTNTRGC